jgi:hypothetical protein
MNINELKEGDIQQLLLAQQIADGTNKKPVDSIGAFNTANARRDMPWGTEKPDPIQPTELNEGQETIIDYGDLGGLRN